MGKLIHSELCKKFLYTNKWYIYIYIRPCKWTKKNCGTWRCNWCARNNPQIIIKGTENSRNKRISRDHLNNIIIQISPNAEKSHRTFFGILAETFCQSNFSGKLSANASVKNSERSNNNNNNCMLFVFWVFFFFFYLLIFTLEKKSVINERKRKKNNTRNITIQSRLHRNKWRKRKTTNTSQ